MAQQSEREKLLFTHHNYDYQNSSTNEQKEFVNNNGQVPYVSNYWEVQPYPNWNQPMETIPYAQYPPNVYNQPYPNWNQPMGTIPYMQYPPNVYNQPYPNWNQPMGTIPYMQYPPNVYNEPYGYPITQPDHPQYLNTSTSYPTPLSESPINKQSGALLPPAPLDRNTEELKPVDVISPSINSIHVQQTVESVVPMQSSQPPLAPPPSYYYPYYEPYPPSLPSPYYYYDASSQPPIPRRESSHERAYYGRRRHDNPLIMAYFGRRHNIESYRKHN